MDHRAYSFFFALTVLLQLVLTSAAPATGKPFIDSSSYLETQACTFVASFIPFDQSPRQPQRTYRYGLSSAHPQVKKPSYSVSEAWAAHQHTAHWPTVQRLAADTWDELPKQYNASFKSPCWVGAKVRECV
jgi:hypothetical protein